MAGEVQPGAPAQPQVQAQQQPGERPPANDQDKALAADVLKRIKAALSRHEKAHKQFEANRKLMRGLAPDGTSKRRTNLHFANLAAIRPQIYAKDPEYTVRPKAGVPADRKQAVQAFSQTAELVLTETLVKEARLKKRAKRLLTGVYTTAVGWWKVSWQEDKRTDPLIENQLKDTQDNLLHLQTLREQLDDPQALASHELKVAEVQQTLAGLQAKAEISVTRGIVIDFVMSEDIIIVDDSVREVGDYERSDLIAHRVWMTRRKYRQTFGYEAKGAKGYTEAPGQTQIQVSQASPADRDSELVCVFEAWDQTTNRVMHLCDGEEGFCQPPSTPDWTGKRWYPFFLIVFNESEGGFYPQSDVELTEPLVEEYNTNRSDFVRDRKACLPLNVVREGGSLSPDDVQKLTNRQGGDTIVVKGTPGTPLSQDIFSGSLGNLQAVNYDTAPARADIEQLIGGGDASRGAVLKAKTATEAEILSQGLRGRSAERSDTTEDLLSEVGTFSLQVLLRKLSAQEVARIAGPEAANSWPTLTVDEIFDSIDVEVRGGSTGKPDRLQEQDRWTKLLPVLKETIAQVAELYGQGQVQLAQAVIELARETLKRFDERIDIEQFLPPPPEDGQADPAVLREQLQMAAQRVKELEAELAKARDEVEKGYVQAAAQIATSANPMTAAMAFGQVITAIENKPEPTQPGADPAQPTIAPMIPEAVPMQ
jgi:hypothetical protein